MVLPVEITNMADISACEQTPETDVEHAVSFANPSRVERVCRNGICMRTGCRHQVLAGIDPVSKCFWTHVAEAYPRALAAALARMLDHGRKELQMQKLGEHLQF